MTAMGRLLSDRFWFEKRRKLPLAKWCRAGATAVSVPRGLSL